MRVAVIGGGPGGLYFAALAARLDPGREITVYDQNPAGRTFGFGVVFSDETLGGIEQADPEIHRTMAAEFARWDDIDVHHRGTVTTSGGHGFAALGRVRLLEILRDRCEKLGVRVRTGQQAPPLDALTAGHDLVVAADGVHSATRERRPEVFRPTVESRGCRYIWLGTDKVFDAFTFWIAETPHGVVQVHAYPYDRSSSTLIVEMAEPVWRRHGFDRLAEAADRLPAGDSDAASVDRCQRLVAPLLDGHPVRGNNSRWISFRTVRCGTWRHGRVVLLGDAAHTAHFSIGSGTKLAMEDALALAANLGEHPTVDDALAAYEAERQPVVLSTQRAAQASLEWFEQIGQYTWQPPTRFAVNLLTRSRRVTVDNLTLRDPEFAARARQWYAEHEVARGVTPGPAVDRPPMFQPYRLGGLLLKNRVVVSAMDMYSAVDGVPTDFHLVHLGSKALGGAALVMTEMVCVSPTGRITPGCTGLYSDEQGSAWRRIVDFVHRDSTARIGVQLGHSGRKGSTRLMWEGIDQPLPTGNWPVVGPSPVPYSPESQVPRELTVSELAAIRDEFVASARRAADAGFDLLELHCAHGYLLSSFLSPLTNRRADGYGGALAGRLRFPLEVLDAVREVWPADRPVTVRISATDWAPDGLDADDAVAVARAFAEHGAAGIDVSTGQVVSHERPAYGRSYQTPFADRISNEVARHTGLTVIAVGAISSYDDVNSILLAGRADLCALGRTHLYDPQWTLHAAAEQGCPDAEWPVPFRAGSRRPQAGRAEAARPRLSLVAEPVPVTRHARWRPVDPS
ncbi:MAG: bifunctional salicylyl-CoA 5-hydroxylase/oxidoreductase [Actinocatenispora sp.]